MSAHKNRHIFNLYTAITLLSKHKLSGCADIHIQFTTAHVLRKTKILLITVYNLHKHD